MKQKKREQFNKISTVKQGLSLKHKGKLPRKIGPLFGMKPERTYAHIFA